jgi:hypothetical protein
MPKGIVTELQLAEPFYTPERDLVDKDIEQFVEDA